MGLSVISRNVKQAWQDPDLVTFFDTPESDLLLEARWAVGSVSRLQELAPRGPALQSLNPVGTQNAGDTLSLRTLIPAGSIVGSKVSVLERQDAQGVTSACLQGS